MNSLKLYLFFRFYHRRHNHYDMNFSNNSINRFPSWSILKYLVIFRVSKILRITYGWCFMNTIIVLTLNVPLLDGGINYQVVNVVNMLSRVLLWVSLNKLIKQFYVSHVVRFLYISSLDIIIISSYKICYICVCRDICSIWYQTSENRNAPELTLSLFRFS